MRAISAILREKCVLGSWIRVSLVGSIFLAVNRDGEFNGGTSDERHADRPRLGHEHRDLRYAQSRPWVRVALDSNTPLVFARYRPYCFCESRTQLCILFTHLTFVNCRSFIILLSEMIYLGFCCRGDRKMLNLNEIGSLLSCLKNSQFKNFLFYINCVL